MAHSPNGQRYAWGTAQVARRGARGGVSRCETSGRVVSPRERSQGFD